MDKKEKDKRLKALRDSVKYPNAFKNDVVDLITVQTKKSGKHGEYSTWINNFLSLHKDQISNEIIGFDISGLQKILEMVKETKNEEIDEELVEEMMKDMEKAGWKREIKDDK